MSRRKPPQSRLAQLVDGRTLIIVDAEGAEVDVLDPVQAPGLLNADILVELHDFLRPEATEQMLARFVEREQVLISQRNRDPDQFPLLAALTEADQKRALDESRHPLQQWLWLPAAR